MKNRIMFRLIIFAALFLACNGFVFSLFKPSVEISISGNNQNTISFFYDNSSEGYPFDDTHMTSASSFGEGVHNFTVPIPSKSLNKLRIDFGTVPNLFEVYSFSISKSPVFKKKFSGDEFLKIFSKTNDISEYNVKDGIVNIRTSGIDGHIYSLNMLTNAPLTIRQDFLQQEFFLVGVSLMLIFIDKILLLINEIYRKSKYLICSRQNNREKVIGFVLVLFYAILCALLLDVVVFRAIAKIAQICGFDTLNRYFSPAFAFSFGRLYFLSIFFFIAGLLLYIGKKKAIRYRYAIAFLFLILIVGGRFTGSSLGFYDGMLLSNTPNYEKSTLLGIPQGIRGDEWATEKPYYFAQIMANNKLPYFNNNLNFDGNDMVVSAFAPVKDIIILARPDLWGFLLFPKEFAFSFYWWFRLILLFMASFEMGFLLTKRYRYAAYAAVIITFAPPVQWWLSQTLMLMLMSGQFALVLFNNYLNSKKIYSKAFSLLGIGFFAMVYVLTMYPASQVPLAYIFMAVFIYLIIENRKYRPFAPRRIVGYILALMPFIGIIVHFFIKSRPAIHTMMNTIYPGSNRPWIPLPWDYDLFQFVNVFTAIIRQPDFLNASEISQFYTFFPFVVLIAVVLVVRYRRKALLPALLLCASVTLWLVSWLPQIPTLNKITLLNYTYPVRITYAYGFGITLLIITLLPLLEKKMRKVYPAKTAGIIAGIIFFLTLCVLTNSDNVFRYFKAFSQGTIIMILTVALLSYMGYSLLRGGTKRIRKFAVLLVLLSVGSTYMVNPITQGMDAMFEKAMMAKIREINAKDNGRWMVSGSPTISNLVTAQGVARTTGTYYYPDWTMMEIIDKNHKFVDLWNQFAHIDMRLTDKSLDISIFDYEKSEKVNGTNRIIYIPIETARELKIKYIFTMIPIPKSIIDKGEVTLLSQDKVDQWSIYRVNED